MNKMTHFNEHESALIMFVFIKKQGLMISDKVIPFRILDNMIKLDIFNSEL